MKAICRIAFEIVCVMILSGSAHAAPPVEFLRQFKIEIAQMIVMGELTIDNVLNGTVLTGWSPQTGDAYHILRVEPSSKLSALLSIANQGPKARYFYFIDPNLLFRNNKPVHGYEGSAKFAITILPEHVLLPGEKEGFPNWGRIDTGDFLNFQGPQILLSNKKVLVSKSLKSSGQMRNAEYMEYEISDTAKERFASELTLLTSFERSPDVPYTPEVLSDILGYSREFLEKLKYTKAEKERVRSDLLNRTQTKPSSSKTSKTLISANPSQPSPKAYENRYARPEPPQAKISVSNANYTVRGFENGNVVVYRKSGQFVRQLKQSGDVRGIAFTSAGLIVHTSEKKVIYDLKTLDATKPKTLELLQFSKPASCAEALNPSE